MDIYTSYFGKLKKLKEKDILPVSIALGTPHWFFGRIYSPLNPRKEMLRMSEGAYRVEYDKILRLNPPMRVLHDLEQIARNNGVDAIALICFETPDKFCHRHLVAEWFRDKLGIEVKEFDYVPKMPEPEQLDLF